MTFEEELEAHGRFIFTNQGVSMWPLIRPGRDVIEITARSAPLKRYDAVLYKDGKGRYILHRIIRANGNTYDILGDNNIRLERGVKDEQIIGVLTAVVRDGTLRVDFSSASYKAYVWLWYGMYPIRIAILWLANLVKSLCRGLLRRG